MGPPETGRTASPIPPGRGDRKSQIGQTSSLTTRSGGARRSVGPALPQDSGLGLGGGEVRVPLRVAHAQRLPQFPGPSELRCN